MKSVLIESLTIDELENLLNRTFERKMSEVVAAKFQQQNFTEDVIKPFLTRRQAAKKLNISLVTLKKWTDKGTLKAYRISSRIRYKEEEIDAALPEIQSFKYKKG